MKAREVKRAKLVARYAEKVLRLPTISPETIKTCSMSGRSVPETSIIS